jgi:hypothetical protein
MNNRQNGRRRGRGGQQARNGQPGGHGNGSRLDNRARGNAAQLLEKYKTLARDAQMQGDRVNTEYYLQFADHYFRVLSENRARFEEQRPQRNDDRDDYGDEDGGEGQQSSARDGDDMWDDGEPVGEQPQRAAPRNDRPGGGNGYARDGEGRRDRGRRNGGYNQPQAGSEGDEAAGASFAPDFISQRIEAQPANPQLEQDVAEASSEAGDEAPRRTRRPRRPRSEAVVEA